MITQIQMTCGTIYQQNITIEMVSLNEWNVTVENLLNYEASNQLRSDIAQTCAAALGTDEIVLPQNVLTIS